MIETDTSVSTYQADAVQEACAGGYWTNLTANGATHLSTTFKGEKEEAPVTEESALCGPPVSHEQKMGLEVVLIRAKAIERQQFLNARAVQGAILEGQKLTAEAEHKFNLSVLESLHTGLTQEAIETHLFDAGFTQLENRVESIHLLDTSLLYGGTE